MAITPTLSLYLNGSDPSQPVFVSPNSNTLAAGISVNSGDKVTLRIYWVTTTGETPVFDLPAETGSVVLAAKKRPGDEDLVYYNADWTWEDDYIEGEIDFASPEGFWDNAAQKYKSLIANVEVRTTANAARITWSFQMQVIRDAYGTEEPPPEPPQPYLDEATALQIFVAYDRAQTLTTEQKAQARSNIGAGSGSGDLIDAGTITLANAGKVAVITALKTLGAGVSYASDATANSLIQRDGSGGSTVVVSTATGGGVFGVSGSTVSSVIGPNSGSGNAQVWKNAAGTTVATMDNAGGLVLAEERFILNSDGDFFSTGTVSTGGGTFTVSATGEVVSRSNITVQVANLLRNWFISDSYLEHTEQIDEVSSYVDFSYHEGILTLSNSTTSGTVVINGLTGEASFGSNVTANGHFKSQGDGAGGAGHLILKQGTIPSGTGSSTTIYGLTNGFAAIEGNSATNVAAFYFNNSAVRTYTLPNETGTFVLTGATQTLTNKTLTSPTLTTPALGTPASGVLTSCTGLPLSTGITGTLAVANGGTGADNARDARQNIGAASFRMSQIPVNDSAWSTATVSGSVSTNTYTNGARFIQILTATSGAGRANFNNANVSSFLPGTRTQVDYSQSFTFSVSGIFNFSATTTSKGLITPAASSTLAATDLAAKGLAIRFAGTGSVVQVMIQSHNGTSAVNSSAYTYGTASENISDLRLVWIAGTGAYLYLDGTLICSMTTNLPSGSGTSAHTCPSLIVEDANTSNGAVVRLTTITAARG